MKFCVIEEDTVIVSRSYVVEANDAEDAQATFEEWDAEDKRPHLIHENTVYSSSGVTDVEEVA